MHLSRDIMVRLHEGELSPAEAFAEQEARESAIHTIAPDKALARATALVTKAVIGSPLGESLVAACARVGVHLDLCECYQGYTQAAQSARNLITWGMKLPHTWYVADGRNVLFLENGLLSQRHGVYMDAGGYFADSSIVTSRAWERQPTPVERAALAAHLAREFGEQACGERLCAVSGPVMVALQTPDDAPLRHYLTRGHGDGLQYVINAAACYLPEGVPVILRPHPRHEFEAAHYAIPSGWTIARGGNVYADLRTCRALVTANSTLGIEAMALGVPVAFLGRHAYSGSGAGLECDGCPDRLAGLLAWRPDQQRIEALLCAILRRQIPYRATVADVERSAQFNLWLQRCVGSPARPAADSQATAYAAAAMRIRCRRDPVLWALVAATDGELARCRPCARSRHMTRIIDADRLAHGGSPVLSQELIRHLAAAGLDVHRPDLTGYTDRLAGAQDSCRVRRELPAGDITLGFLYGGHLGDAICTTAVATSMRTQGRAVSVVRHRNTLASFAEHGIEHRNAGRIAMGPPAEVGAGQVIQRMQRWLGLPEEPFPRPDLRLSTDEIAWAADYCQGLPRPLILMSTGALSNADGYATMPWAEWGRVLSDFGTVIQCLGSDSDPRAPCATMAAGLSMRQWVALFGQASAYVGTWAAGIHCAAAFGLESIVVTHPPVDPRCLTFPLPPKHIITFLYPQHAYGIPTQPRRQEPAQA